MRPVILTIGTRGDVQPFIALALGLRAAGHQPLLVAPEPFRVLVTSFGVEFAAFPGDPAALIQRLVDRGGGLMAIPQMIDFAMPVARHVMRAAIETTRDADIILASFLIAVGGYQAARQHRVPFLSAQLFPAFTPTSAFAMPGLPSGALVFNRLTHQISTMLFWTLSLAAYQMLKRQAPELPRRLENPFGRSLRTIYGFSPQVVPSPLDTHPTWMPPAELQDFLAAGEPPLYIGFGSMRTVEAERIYSIVIDALTRLNQRAILMGEWKKVGGSRLPAHILRMEAAPHDWLFERVAAVVHHGGAGTTAAGLRAGRPSLIIPFTADQPFWGQRILAAGVGPRPIPVKRLTAQSLLAAIETMREDTAMRMRAADLGTALRAEDGIGNAVRVIESIAAGS